MHESWLISNKLLKLVRKQAKMEHKGRFFYFHLLSGLRIFNFTNETTEQRLALKNKPTRINDDICCQTQGSR